MKKIYEDPEMNVTRFEYEEIMTSMTGDVDIPGNDGDWSE